MMQETLKVLVVDDDARLRSLLERYLTEQNFIVRVAQDSDQMDRLLTRENFHLMVLDLMLPGEDGLSICKRLRNEGNNIPVIMLTARTDLIDKVLGLESGASDYLTKPFEPRELLARIRVQLRKPQTGNPDEVPEVFTHKNLSFHLSERKAFYNDDELILTKMEFDLLYLLATHPNQVFSREKLLDEVWGYENYPTTRTVDTHVLQIRQKTHNNLIETVRGIGYRFNPNHD